MCQGDFHHGLLDLEDEKGENRASLGVFKDGPALDLFDEKGEPRASLSIFKDQPGLALWDEKGRPTWATPR